MGISGVHHTGIIVSNLGRSIYFYHDLLGLKFASEPSPWFSGADLERGVGVPGATLRQVNLKAGDDILELLEYGNRPADNTEPQPQNRLGAMHVALRVDNIASVVTALESAGVQFLTPPTTIDDGVLAGWRWVYFHDPDGITVELVEEAYSMPHEDAINRYLESRPTLESLTTRSLEQDITV